MQRGLHVGGHVVRAFERVRIRKIFWREMIQRAFQVVAHIAVCVFIDCQRGGCVLDEDMQESRIEISQLRKRRENLAGNQVTAASKRS